jgi:hypothetical protein
MSWGVFPRRKYLPKQANGRLSASRGPGKDNVTPAPATELGGPPLPLLLVVPSWWIFGSVKAGSCYSTSPSPGIPSLVHHCLFAWLSASTQCCTMALCRKCLLDWRHALQTNVCRPGFTQARLGHSQFPPGLRAERSSLANTCLVHSVPLGKLVLPQSLPVDDGSCRSCWSIVSSFTASELNRQRSLPPPAIVGSTSTAGVPGEACSFSSYIMDTETSQVAGAQGEYSLDT